MDVEVMTGGVASGDELLSLRTWLLDEPEFRGRVSLRETPPQPGKMGPITDALVLALASGGGVVLARAALRTLGSVLVAWLRSRTGQVEVTARRADGAEVTLSATQVRRLSAADVAQLLDDLVSRLDPSPDGEGDRAGSGLVPRLDSAPDGESAGSADAVPPTPPSPPPAG
jgi:Effector Associated Constant Component 1